MSVVDETCHIAVAHTGPGIAEFVGVPADRDLARLEAVDIAPFATSTGPARRAQVDKVRVGDDVDQSAMRRKRLRKVGADLPWIIEQLIFLGAAGVDSVCSRPVFEVIPASRLAREEFERHE